jgi:hypothetical protein
MDWSIKNNDKIENMTNRHINNYLNQLPIIHMKMLKETEEIKDLIYEIAIRYPNIIAYLIDAKECGYTEDRLISNISSQVGGTIDQSQETIRRIKRLYDDLHKYPNPQYLPKIINGLTNKLLGLRKTINESYGKSNNGLNGGNLQINPISPNILFSNMTIENIQAVIRTHQLPSIETTIKMLRLNQTHCSQSNSEEKICQMIDLLGYDNGDGIEVLNKLIAQLDDPQKFVDQITINYAQHINEIVGDNENIWKISLNDALELFDKLNENKSIRQSFSQLCAMPRFRPITYSDCCPIKIERDQHISNDVLSYYHLDILEWIAENYPFDKLEQLDDQTYNFIILLILISTNKYQPSQYIVYRFLNKHMVDRYLEIIKMIHNKSNNHIMQKEAEYLITHHTKSLELLEWFLNQLSMSFKNNEMLMLDCLGFRSNHREYIIMIILLNTLLNSFINS